MKEKIYTIPINEAIEENSECPFCSIAKKLETETVEYTLGAAMMEPDYRILCNEKGFCNHHSSLLFKQPNKLSLALIMDSHFEELRKNLSAFEKELNPSKRKNGFFKKTPAASVFSKASRPSCVICDKINNTIERYAEVFFYMWKNDNAFCSRVLNSKGFCMPHFYYLTEKAEIYLKNPQDFIIPAFEKQKAELERIQKEIHHFTLKFDYRNKDMDWGTSKDAPIRSLEKTAGFIEKYDTK